MNPLLADAIEKALIGGNHLALLIGTDHPPYTAETDEALEHYGAGDQYEIWCAWRALMRLSRIWETCEKVAIPSMSMPRPDGRHTAEHLGRDLDRFKAENEQLRAALKPFAEVAAMADADVPDDAIACALLGDFRRAAELCN